MPPRRMGDGNHFTWRFDMQIEAKLKAMGYDIEPAVLGQGKIEPAVRTGNLVFTSGQVSRRGSENYVGKVGSDLTVEQGYAAAKNCAEKILRSAWQTHGTLDGLRVIKVLGCVNSTLDFTDQHLVINGASDLLHQIFGKDGDGYHARSALGFAQLPTGAAVEVEVIFEIKG